MLGCVRRCGVRSSRRPSPCGGSGRLGTHGSAAPFGSRDHSSSVSASRQSTDCAQPCVRLAAAILSRLPDVRITTDSVPSDGRAHEGLIRHILLVAYLYPPCNAASAHRPHGLRRAFESSGIRTTVLTSKISGSYADDGTLRVVRAGDLRTRFRTQYQTLVGYREGPLEARARPRWWTNFIVPDPTAVSWVPQALVHLISLIRSDRPDLIVTTSGPESSHLLGLVASLFGIRWVADYRDPWLRDAEHPSSPVPQIASSSGASHVARLS